jgi:hypothetical protein
MENDSEYTAPESKEYKVLKAVIQHTENTPPFIGDDDHWDAPIPEHAKNDIVFKLNTLLKEAGERGLDAGTVRGIVEAIQHINNLRNRLYEIKLGFEGCCHACEPVGHKNKLLEEELQEVRRMYCISMAENVEAYRRKDGQNVRCGPEDIAEMKGWNCFEDKHD